MEFSAGSIGVFFKAQTSDLVKGIEDVNKRLDGFKQGVEALGAFEAFKKIAGAVVACVDASSEAEINVRKLQAVVSSQTDVSKFQALAGHLSQITTFSDDAAMSALSLLGKFNLTDREMASLLPKVADFAAFMGTDLPQAADIAGRAVANGASGLRGLGLAFTDAEKKSFEMATQQERVAILMDKMTGSFNGVAQAVAETGAGAMKQFDNSVAELQETLGTLVDGPTATFFQGLTGIVNLATNAIGNMGETAKTIITIVGGIIGTFAALTVGTMALQTALAFFGGLPAIMTAVSGAMSTVVATMATVIAPLTVMAGTLVMIEGMVSRIRDNKFDMNEGIFEGIKNNFKAGLDDIRNGMKGLFEAPATAMGSMTDAVKGFDNTLRTTTAKLAGLDFSKEMIEAQGDVFQNISDSIGMDFSKAENADGASTGALNSSLNAAVAGRDMTTQGMSAEDVQARAAALAQSVSGVDIAVAGLKTAGMQLAGKLGATGTAFANVMTKMASGDPVGAVVGLGVEMLTRTKSFGKVMQFIEKIFTQLSQVLEPLIDAVMPLLEAISELMPIIVQLAPEIKVLGFVIKKVGEGLLWIVKGIAGFWNAIVEGIANLLSFLPFVGDDLARRIRDAKVDISKQQEIAAPPIPKVIPDELPPAVKDVTTAFKELAETTQNLPEGFKIAAQRFAAIQRGEGDPEATAQALQQILQQQHPGTMAGIAVPTGKQVYAPGTVPVTHGPVADTTTMPGYAIMPSGGYKGASQVSGGIVGVMQKSSMGAPPINIDKLTVTANDPQELVAAMQAEQMRATYVRTGKTSMGDSTRQYWGK
jgi:hypothetical protein